MLLSSKLEVEWRIVNRLIVEWKRLGRAYSPSWPPFFRQILDVLHLDLI